MIGTTLSNRYRIDSELSRGGLGIVYQGHDILLERDVAIKVINTNVLGSEGNTRLFQEARVIAQLHHPNIVTVYDAGEINDTTYVIMELVEGKSLHDSPPKDLEELVSITKSICAGLEHAHQHGVIHRDLKPENVMISPDGRVRLMDFGLARSITSRLTSEGALLGTVFYMAPEQALGQAIDKRADLYALGVMLYELSTGRLPFSGEDPMTVISQHVHTPPVPPCAINPQIPLQLETLILQLMSKRADDRPAFASEVLHLLENIWQQPSPAPVEYQEGLTLARIVRGRIVGREKELNELMEAWQRLLMGQSDERVLLVSGEPGVGKTRLARELTTRAAVQKAIVLLGECYAEEGAPYAPVAQVIHQALLHTSIVGKRLLDSRVVANLLALTPDLQARFPEVGPSLKLDPKDEQQRLYDSVLELMICLAQSAPIMLVIDDAHWADRASLFLLRHLARRSKMLKLPLLIVATYREVELDEARPWHEVLGDLNRERLSMRLKLSRLDKRQTRDMLAVLFNEEITPELLDGIYYETEGNPFFVEEVVKTLVDEGKIYYQDGRWHRPAMNEIVIPQSVRIAIQTRLAALQPGVQDMLRMAAILGREFDDNLIRQATEFEEEPLITALEAAEKAQLIGEITASQPGQVRYSFLHALIHATIYESTSGLRRQRLHRRAAEAIEAIRPADFEALTTHYQEGGDFEKARKNALKAGERALTLYANQDAEKYFKIVLELDGPEAEKAVALSGLGQALFRQSRFKESVDIWKQAGPIYQQLRDYNRVARTYASMSEATRCMGDIETGIAIGEEGLALLENQPPTPGKIALMRETGNSMTMRGWRDKARALYHQALDAASEIGNLEEQAESLIRLGFEHYFSIRPDRLEGLRMLQRALALAESSGLTASAEMAHTYLSEMYYAQGEINEAMSHIEKAVSLCHQMGLANGELFALNIACSYQYLLGNFSEFKLLLDKNRHLVEFEGFIGPAVLGSHIATAMDLLAKREVTLALQLLRDTYKQAMQSHNINWAIVIAQYLSLCLIPEGMWADAEQLLTEVLPLSEQDDYLIVGSILAISYSLQNKLSDSRTILKKIYLITDKNINYWGQVYSSFAEAILSGKERHWEDAWTQFDTVYKLVNSRGIRWMEAEILHLWLEVLLDRGKEGDEARARDLLDKAIGLYKDMGLTAWAEYAETRFGAML